MTKQAYRRRLKVKSRVRRNKILQEAFLYLGIAVFVFSGLSLASGIKAGSKPQMVNKDYFKTVKIKEGDTLWRIAEKYAPLGSDYRLYISQLMEINRLSSSNIYAGQKILIPAERVPPYAPPTKPKRNLACLSYTNNN